MFGYSFAAETQRYMIIGLAVAILSALPFYGWIFAKHWPYITGFPIGWLGAGMIYMITFFHEIGHSLFAWLFGYPTIPTFDFEHGGGMAYSISGQQIALALLVQGGIAYGTWYFRGEVLIQIAIAAFLLVITPLTFTHYHMAVIDFMGPGLVPIIGAFFLFRALFDLAPRGSLERFLNAYFGFGFFIITFIEVYALLYNQIYRLVYYQQKGSHGFGDFDKIADRLLFANFEGVIYFLATFTLFWFVLPFILLVMEKRA